jgi:endo-1,3(4)-beta-glucanase
MHTTPAPACSSKLLAALLCIFIAGCGPGLSGVIVEAGLGSYTTQFPGVDSAGRNGFPGGAPQLSGAAVGRPVPTNDWWSALVKNDHAANLFNYPLGMRTRARGLDIGYVVPGSGPNGSVQPLSDQSPVVVGVSGLSASRATVADYGDWTVTIGWDGGGRQFRATSGVGMPFVYFEKSAGAEARVEVNMGTASVSGERLLITNSQSGANFAVYGPAGAQWTQSGNVYTSTLAGKDYWSMAILPPGQPAAAAAAELAAHAFAFPVGTLVDWQYDEATALLRVDYTIETEVKEGTEDRVMQGLLPHQWAWLGAGSPEPQGPVYPSIRGSLKMLAGNHFFTGRKFSGILPTLPFIPDGSDRFSLAELTGKIDQMKDESLATWTDSYNEGQVMNRLIQTARIADLLGNAEARDRMLATVKERLEDWFTAEPGEVAFLFYYNAAWSALIGYPAGHGQDTNLNDHHFHWGYFIHAAAFVEQFEPGWAADWGPMVQELIRDCANPSRTDPRYPFLRNFSPYAGHSWANGFATFPQGNDQESTSESMQFNSSLIHWGEVTGDTAVRDLGIYMYVTEQSAIEEYWLDIHGRNLKPEYQYSLVSRVWGNGYDNGTFWTSDIAAAYGIELYPIHGGSLYLGHDLDYAQRLWTEMAANTGILSNQANDNLWHDVYWSFLAFTDAELALDLHDSYPDRSLKFGISDAQTYHWLHAMYALGPVHAAVTADHPVATAFGEPGALTYVAHNYADEPLIVNFSDGAALAVPPRSMATSRDVGVRGVLSLDFQQADPGGSIRATVHITSGTADQVVFMLDDQVYATVGSAPYEVTVSGLQAGVRSLYARVYSDGRYNITNPASVVVGRQQPYEGVPWPIPGIIEAGKYDRFEGGSGQGIAYHDTSPGNAGTFRTDESVDATVQAGEGAVVGWTAAGEWLEYTVGIPQSGVYAMSFRYASGNNQERGPVRFLLSGNPVTGDIALPATAGWNSYASAAVPEVELIAGTRILRVEFVGGEVNIGRMEFTYVRELPADRPRADAGATVFVLLPDHSAQLDGSASSVGADRDATYAWTQLYGPSAAQLSDAAAVSPIISGLVEGIYRFRLDVDDGEFLDSAEVQVVVSFLEEFPPQVSLTRPTGPLAEPLGKPVLLAASATDLDGEIDHVAFYSGSLRIGAAWGPPPYQFEWVPPAQGLHRLTAMAVDDSGLTSLSAPVDLLVEAPLPCGGTAANGDFSYEFTQNGSAHSLTFIPERAGVGQTTCILYYSTTGAAPFPGHPATPGVPFTLNAASGQTIYFYYTYSHPAGGERNTMDQIVSRTLGVCGEPEPPDAEAIVTAWRQAWFPPFILDDADARDTLWGDLADPDGDGYSNLIECLLGTDPLTPDHAAIAPGVDGAGQPVFTFSRRSHLPPGFAVIEWSTDLDSWSSSGLIETIDDADPGIESVQARPPAPHTMPVFFRIGVGENWP